MMSISAIFQYVLWQHNIWWHNPFRNECTPDFGCCVDACKERGEKPSLWKTMDDVKRCEEAVEFIDRVQAEGGDLR